MRKEELKSCPFCGEEARIERMGTSRFSMQIECCNCGASMESCETFIDDNSSWNTRTPQSEWVSIAQPPMADGFYLVFANYIVNSWVELLGFKEGQWIDMQNNIFPATITHWMPLPTPPKGA